MARFLLLSDCCGFVNGGPALTRGRVRSLQLLLALASLVILELESQGNYDHFYCLRFETPPTRREFPVFMSHRKRLAQLYVQELSTLSIVSYDPQGYGRGIRTRLHAGGGGYSIQCHFPLTITRYGLHRKNILRHSNHSENTVPLFCRAATT
jgi:hypothetical protein